MKRIPLLLLPLFFAVLISPLLAQPLNPDAAIFTRITEGTHYMDRSSTYGVSWCDYNNDGFEDFFAVNNPGPCRLYKNNGDGTFFYDSLAGFSTSIEPFLAATWGDYNNDGWQDVFITTSAISGPGSHQNYLYKNNGNGTFTSVGGEVTSGGGWAIGAAWGDYDNDGHLDLYVANWDSENYLFRNNGNETFTKILTGAPATDPGASYAATFVDFDNDGWQDIFVANYYTTTYPPDKNNLYRNNGNGTFTKITTGDLVNDTTLSTGSSWGDYDNDGFLDVFIPTSYFHGDYNMLWHNNGDGTFTKLPTAVPSLDQNTCYGSGWADYNNDGNLDLYVSANRSGQRTNFLYENNGDGSFTKITTSAINLAAENSFGGAWGDYNNDGFPDLYVATGSSTRMNQFFRNDDSTYNWIKFRLVANYSNRSAIGARIVLYSGGIKQTRVLQGNTGQYSQGSLYPVFGLKQSTVIDSVRVYWPSGMQDIYHNLAAGQIKVIEEGETIPVELLNFSAKISGNNVILNWSTATETNNKGFDVLKSSDKKNWNILGYVAGSGSSTEQRSYSYTDEDVNQGKYYYKLVQIDYDGTRTEKNIVEVDFNNQVTEFSLSQNYPNPFNPVTKIEYSVLSASNVEIRLFNVLGSEVAVLLNEVKTAGKHSFNFNASGFNSGVYFYTLKAGNYTATRKMIIMK
jgi:enediyne biosynthesis protein E4